ncbi:MAG: ATP-binding cassette domain-containing protein [Campylobacter sp.]|nr:ATP-binding cassette domain-containing protein [Campylobacter sp.]
MSSLELRNLNIYNGKNQLIYDLNITLNLGKITALLGKSGSGKTLTSMAMMGFLPTNLTKTSGELKFDGKAIDPSLARGKIFSNIMQNPKTAFNQILKVKTHAIETLKASKNYDKNYKALILQTLKKVGLEDRVYELYPFEMSGGMLQRAMIAMALLAKPKFIIADEPTTDLDMVSQIKILKLLKDISSSGIGMLLITHDLGVVRALADDIYLINSGKIIEKATTSEFFNSPKTAISQNLIATYERFQNALLKE